MFKKVLLLVFCLSLMSSAYAQDIPVVITPINKITTSNINLREGDQINFEVAHDVLYKNTLIKRGTRVEGVITDLVDNSFTCQEASLFAENFKIVNPDSVVYLKGVVSKKGRTHWMAMQFIPLFYVFVRGGEVQLEPIKDEYTLYLETCND